MLSTAFALPTIAVLTFAYFGGGFRRAEEARCLPVMEPDYDWWDRSSDDGPGEARRALSSDAPKAGDA